MSTEPPRPPKRQRREELARSQVQQDVTALVPEVAGSIKARFVDADGNHMTDAVEVPILDVTEKKLSLLLNTLLQRDHEEQSPFRFRIHTDGDGVIDTIPGVYELLATLQKHGIANPFETTITLSAEPQAVFKVQVVSRLAHRIPGHGQPILAAQFSPASSGLLVTGSGDNTARIWDTDTGTPKHTLKGHTGHVLGVCFSPDGKMLATCSMDMTVRIWDPSTGQARQPGELRGHAKDVRALAWQPYHLWHDGTARLVSAGKDATARIWVVNTGRTEHVLSGHKGAISAVRWGIGSDGRHDGGGGMVYTSSHDKTVRCWDAARGTLVHELKAHAHWVNALALSTDHVLRTGFYEYAKEMPTSENGRRARARERVEKAARIGGKLVERLVSASDDFTMYLWDPLNSGTKPVARMVGHQKTVNYTSFSPDGSLIASVGWDNSTKIWSAKDGRFLASLRGHVAPVYRCAFSADSRLLVTCSKDTSLKVWSMRTFKLVQDLPGHEDEVWAVDWSPDGKMVGSGGRDKAVRTWRN